MTDVSLRTHLSWAKYELLSLRKFIYGPGIDEPVFMIDLTNSVLNKCYEYDAFGEPEGKRDVDNAYLITAEGMIYWGWYWLVLF